MLKKAIRILGVVGALSLSTFLAAQEEGTPFPFTVYETYADFAPVMAQDNDTTYVINFWATWCKPCVEELPYFDSLHVNVAQKPVKVLLVSLDFRRDLTRKLVPFLAEHPLKPPVAVLLDGKYNDWIDKVSTEWDGAIPATVVYQGGKRIFHGEQFSSYSELTDLLAELKQ
ncbi:MAG: TlpA family protein disulfide reductase [Lewinellaceae bacterium]|nr:TlpA family protein disulfide reductase [Lewinellaceae bacterium]